MKRVLEPLCKALSRYKRILDCEDSFYFVNYDIKPHTLSCVHRIADVEAVNQPTALAFIVEAYRQGFKRRFNQELAIKLIEDRAHEEAFIFLLINGVPAAQAMIQVATNQISQIGGVYTNESCRGKGYCKALVGELCRRIHSVGKIPTLMVRKDNSPAVRAYQAVGFTYYDEYVIVKFSV
jgi:predicted GNAT family acetyltransferase